MKVKKKNTDKNPQPGTKLNFNGPCRLLKAQPSSKMTYSIANVAGSCKRSNSAPGFESCPWYTCFNQEFIPLMFWCSQEPTWRQTYEETLSFPQTATEKAAELDWSTVRLNVCPLFLFPSSDYLNVFPFSSATVLPLAPLFYSLSWWFNKALAHSCFCNIATTVIRGGGSAGTISTKTAFYSACYTIKEKRREDNLTEKKTLM